MHIERAARKVNVTIHTARPGIVIGKKGEDIEKLRAETARLIGMPVGDVRLNVAEIRKPELDSQLVAEGIAQQIEKRVMFRRAMKRAVMSTMRSGALGMKVRLSGRLNGSEIARTEIVREGRVPLHTFRADIDYAHRRSPHHLWRDRHQGLDLQGRSVRQGAGSRRRRGRRGSCARGHASRGPQRPAATAGNGLKDLIESCCNRSEPSTASSSRAGIPAWRIAAATVAFGEFGLKATERARMTAREIEAARRAMARAVKRGGQIWVRVFPDVPVSKKPLEVRMGSGKGNVEFWIAKVQPGKVLVRNGRRAGRPGARGVPSRRREALGGDDLRQAAGALMKASESAEPSRPRT